MQSHLVSFEYGIGAVWGYVKAPSAGAVEAQIPEVDVATEPPAWMTEAEVRSLKHQAIDVNRADVLDQLIRTEC